MEREYIIRRHLKAAVEAAQTLEEKQALSTSLMASALSLDGDQIGGDLRDEPCLACGAGAVISTGEARSVGSVTWRLQPSSGRVGP